MDQISSRLLASGFVAGILASLAETSRLSFVLGDRFDEALYAAYLRLLDLADAYQLNVRFRASQDPQGGTDSFSRALSLAISSGVAGFRDGDLVPLSAAPLGWLPGSPDLYRDLARVFLSAYRNPSANPLIPTSQPKEK